MSLATILAPGLLLFLASFLGSVGASVCDWDEDMGKKAKDTLKEQVNSGEKYDQACEVISSATDTPKRGCFFKFSYNWKRLPARDTNRCLTFAEYWMECRGIPCIKLLERDSETQKKFDAFAVNHRIGVQGFCEENWPSNLSTMVIRKFPDGAVYVEPEQPSDAIKKAIQKRRADIAARMIEDHISVSRRVSNDSDTLVAVPWELLAEQQSPNKFLDDLAKKVKKKMHLPKFSASSLVESGVHRSQRKAQRLNRRAALLFPPSASGASSSGRAEDSGEHQHAGYTFANAPAHVRENPPDQRDLQAQQIQTHVALSSLRGTDPASYISGSEGAEDSGGVHQQMGRTFVTAPADVLGNQLDQSDPQAQQIQTHVALSSLRGTHPTSDASGSEGAEDSGGHQHAGNTFARMQSPNKILDTVSAEINAEMHQETTGASSLVEGGIRMSQRKARRLNRRADLSSPRGTRPTSSASGSEGAEDSGGHQHTGHNFVTAPADALENQPDQSDSQVGDASPRSAAETAALPGL